MNGGRARFAPAVAILAALAIASTGAACDPVHDDAQASLGGETNGDHPGPTHRPGEPCLVCHDGKVGDPRAFAVAGTVFEDPSGRVGLSGVEVTLKDSAGAVFTTTTNRAGNFYVNAGAFTPIYPMRTTLSYGGQTAQMRSLVGRDGSCAGCHTDPSGPASPGHVYFHELDGGTP